MAQVRISHQDGTVDTITTTGATEEILVQQGDKIEVLGASLREATVDGNNYVVTLADDDGGTVQITFVDLFLLLAVGDPATTPAAPDATTLVIGETSIASIGQALGETGGPAAGGDIAGVRSEGGSRPDAVQFETDPILASEPLRPPPETDLPGDEFPPLPDEVPDVTEEAPEPDLANAWSIGLASARLPEAELRDYYPFGPPTNQPVGVNDRPYWSDWLPRIE